MKQQVVVTIAFGQLTPPRKTTVSGWIQKMMEGRGFVIKKRTETAQGVTILFEREEPIYPEAQ